MPRGATLSTAASFEAAILIVVTISDASKVFRQYRVTPIAHLPAMQKLVQRAEALVSQGCEYPSF